MDQEDNKLGLENTPEVSSNPLSSGKDDMMGTENPPEVLSNLPSSGKDSLMDSKNPLELSSDVPPSGKDDKIGTENPLEVSYNPPTSRKDDMMGTENPLESSSNPPSSEKNDMMGIDNPLELSSNLPSLGKDDMMGTKNPPGVCSNPPSPGKDDMMGIDNPLELSSNLPSLGKDDTMGTKNPPGVSSNPPSPGKDDNKKNIDPSEGSSRPELSDKNNPKSLKAKSKIVKKSLVTKLKAKKNKGSLQTRASSFGKDDMMGTKNPVGVSSNPPSSEKDDNKKDTDPPEGSSKPELSDNNTQKLLKAKSKIVKKSQVGKLKAKKNNGSLQIREKKINRKNKKAGNNAESYQNADEKLNSDDNPPKKNDDEPPKEKNQEVEKNEVTESGNRSTDDKSPMEKSHQAQRNKDKLILLDRDEQKQKNEKKHSESKKGSRNRKNKGKQSGVEKHQSKERKSEKLGGLIFMCNAKTKPDCFRYRVMGVSAGKKDDVLRVKPGLKLFLFDFDLKLLYGVYQASSSGGMKLEPRAFRGKFPAQVRFNIASNCFPLPESIFKKAIKDNYNEKHKFRTELTVGQVRKLTQLFRPVGIHSAVQPICSSPKAIIRQREASDGVRGSRRHSFRDRAAGDRYTNYNHNDRDGRYDYREEATRDLFLDEKNYRAYGLQGDRRNVATASWVNPILDPYERDYKHRHLDPSYRRNVPARLESLRTDPLSLIDSGYRDSFRGAIPDHLKDPYHAYRRDASPRDVYLTTPLSRDEIPSRSYLVGRRPFVETDNLLRREAVQDRLYSVYSFTDALADYNQMRPYHRDKLESSPMPVSHRYSLASPSFSRR